MARPDTTLPCPGGSGNPGLQWRRPIPTSPSREPAVRHCGRFEPRTWMHAYISCRVHTASTALAASAAHAVTAGAHPEPDPTPTASSPSFGAPASPQTAPPRVRGRPPSGRASRCARSRISAGHTRRCRFDQSALRACASASGRSGARIRWSSRLVMVSSRRTGPGGQATTRCTPLELSSSLARRSAARAVESMKLMVAVDRVSEDYSF